MLLAPYILVFLAFVVYPVGYGLWLARHPASYVALYHDPIFARAAVNTLIFLVIGINVKMAIALFLSGFFARQRTWIKWLSVLFILPWAVPSIPTILSVRFMFNPEWGVVNQLIFKFTGEDGPNWLNDPTVALTMAIGVHIWKSLPFWTLILMTGRLAIPHDLYEAAEVNGASWSAKTPQIVGGRARRAGVQHRARSPVRRGGGARRGCARSPAGRSGRRRPRGRAPACGSGAARGGSSSLLPR